MDEGLKILTQKQMKTMVLSVQVLGTMIIRVFVGIVTLIVATHLIFDELCHLCVFFIFFFFSAV